MTATIFMMRAAMDQKKLLDTQRINCNLCRLAGEVASRTALGISKAVCEFLLVQPFLQLIDRSIDMSVFFSGALHLSSPQI